MKKVIWAGCLLAAGACGCTQEPKVIQTLPQAVGTPDRSSLADRSRSRSQARRTAPSTQSERDWIPAIGISDRWECIVLHHSASDVGGAKRFDELHRSPPRNWNELGYHFVIGNGTDTPDGLVEVGLRWPKQKHGAHCKTPDNFYNDHGIGICLVGNFEHSRPTPGQVRSLARLIGFLQSHCSIPDSKIYTHGGVTGHTACPGRNFSLARIRPLINSPSYLSAH